MLAHNTSGRPGILGPLSWSVPCWSHAQSRVSEQMGHVPDENQTSLWNGPGCGQNQYETTERVNKIMNIRTLIVKMLHLCIRGVGLGLQNIPLLC